MNRSSLLLALAVLLACVSTRWITLNLSASVPRGVYWLATVPVPLHRGTLVLLPVPATMQHVRSRWVPFLKPVAAVHGDAICHQDGHLTVNGTDYGPVALEAHGKVLPSLDSGCQTVPDGMVLLASPVPTSIDGRYFGLTAVDTLRATAHPLVTWR